MSDGTFTKERTIPRITHQIWMQGWDNLPSKFHENVKLLREKNPSYRHMVWDEESLRRECASLGDECVKTFENFPYMIQKVDFGRYVVLYKYGGISVDTDMKSLAPIDNTPQIETSSFIVSYSSFPTNLVGQINNAVFLVKPGHFIMKDIIDGIVWNREVNAEAEKVDAATGIVRSKEQQVHMTTGPLYINKMIGKHKMDLVILDYTYYEPCFSVDPYCVPGKESIMDHKHEMSWMNNMFKALFRLFFWAWHNILYIALAAVAVWVALYGMPPSLRRFYGQKS